MLRAIDVSFFFILHAGPATLQVQQSSEFRSIPISGRGGPQLQLWPQAARLTLARMYREQLGRRARPVAP